MQKYIGTFPWLNASNLTEKLGSHERAELICMKYYSGPTLSTLSICRSMIRTKNVFQTRKRHLQDPTIKCQSLNVTTLTSRFSPPLSLIQRHDGWINTCEMTISIEQRYLHFNKFSSFWIFISFSFFFFFFFFLGVFFFLVFICKIYICQI